jgi:DUF1680 family protein
MKKNIFFFSLFLLFSFLSLSYAQQKDYNIKAVDFTKVKFTDKFWLPRIETNRTITIPASFERCENTGRVKNFVMAANKSGKFCTTFPFDDTDIYKTIEGASFSLATHPDTKLEAYIDSLIIIIGKAQEPDGYLYTARTIDPSNPHKWAGKERWEKERELSHELYNAGHLYEAAAAHYLATGKKNLLNIALKNADLVCSVFGPDKKHVAPGHEIVEMGLVKLYRIRHKKEYLQTAAFFVNERGHYNGYDATSKNPWKNGSYWQDNKPVVNQEEGEGHAVRAAYLYSAVADVAALTGNDSLLVAIDRIWNNVVDKKMYVQGSIGAKGDGERFGDDYELPNATAYNETCAAIANVYWNQRMFQLHGESKYIDVLEKTLYNGLISGVGLDGKSFFYTNAMEIRKAGKDQPGNGFNTGKAEVTRSGWFECSCCPTNIVRLVPSIPGYVYAQKENNIYVNLFVNSNATVNLGKNAVNISQHNNYPWDGALAFTIDPKNAGTFNILIRIPGWAKDQAIPSSLYSFEDAIQKKVVVKVNGVPVTQVMQHGYWVINKKWMKGDKITVDLPMEVRRVVTNNIVKENNGKVALQRGPIIYCAEWADNSGTTSNISIPKSASFTPAYAYILNGITVLKGEVQKDNEGKQPFIAIPYYSWANRGKGEMQVWFPEK